MVADWQVFAAIIASFYVGLIIKSVSKRFTKLCSICFAVSVTWLLLLIARTLGWLDSELLLALLIGESVVGGYYLTESKLKNDLLVFRLPILLTLTIVAYSLVTLYMSWISVVMVVVVWGVHGLLFAYRSQPNIRKNVDRIIACCSKW